MQRVPFFYSSMADERARRGNSHAMLRLSIGLEVSADRVADLD